MKNGIYTARHDIAVTLSPSGGDTREVVDTLEITFIHNNGSVDVLSVKSKLDKGLVTLPNSLWVIIHNKIKDKLKTN